MISFFESCNLTEKWMTIKQFYLGINDQTIGQMIDSRFAYSTFITQEAEYCSTQINVYWLLTWFTTLYTIKIAICWGCKQEARLASIQILIKLETNAFTAWAVKECFMSMISFMTGTCEPYACYLDQWIHKWCTCLYFKYINKWLLKF